MVLSGSKENRRWKIASSDTVLIDMQGRTERRSSKDRRRTDIKHVEEKRSRWVLKGVVARTAGENMRKVWTIMRW